MNHKHNPTEIFICYSHKDSKWLERLKIHLKPLVRDGELNVWDDTMIAPGTNWRDAINESINASKVAILLVSADFLASDFISDMELPKLLHAAKNRGVNIIPVIISPSGFQKHPILSDFQAVNSPQRPLINLKRADQEQVWVKVAESIKNPLNGSLPITKVAAVNPVKYGEPPQPSLDSINKLNQEFAETAKKRSVKIYMSISVTLVTLIAFTFFPLYFLNKKPTSESQPQIESESGQRSSAANAGSFELQAQIERAIVYLDLTSSWRELTDAERAGTVPMSRASLFVNFLVRKYSNDAELTHRLGTSSRLEKPFEWSSDHPMKAEPSDMKCSSDIRLAYMLHFDIKHEPINAPFNLNYRIDFWNAHNRQMGDWHAFYVSKPTKMLIFKISFPKNKPYTSIDYLKAEGLECSSPTFKFENPEVQEGIDEATGAKTVIWTIRNPETHYIYRIQWTWE